MRSKKGTEDCKEGWGYVQVEIQPPFSIFSPLQGEGGPWIPGVMLGPC